VRPGGEGEPDGFDAEPRLAMPDSPSLRRAAIALHRRDLRLVAIAAFGIGVLLHLFVLNAFLSGGGDDARRSVEDPVRIATTTAGATPTPAPTRLADRTDCAAIRNTDYRSEAERLWFLRNCLGQ
jgi:hypothetical protein